MKVNRLWNNKYIRIDPSKNSKFSHYMRGFYNIYFPIEKNYKHYLVKKYGSEVNVIKRVKYYNKIQNNFRLNNFISIKEFQKQKKNFYFFDMYRYLRYYTNNLRFSYLFGDVVDVPQEPTIVKSRPIIQNNYNSILMKLNRVRHFIFVNDTIPYEKKKDMLVWRGKAHQQHRLEFLKKFFHHPLCDVGQIVKRKDKGVVEWQKEKLSLKEQLEYKFILAIEGNDVASNLKWAMSSNSLVMMTKPKYETWFMEGLLQPNFHYILLDDDYTNLEEKINYYKHHVQEAQEIIQNANNYVQQFKNQEMEDAISFMVLDKYFSKFEGCVE